MSRSIALLLLACLASARALVVSTALAARRAALARRRQMPRLTMSAARDAFSLVVLGDLHMEDDMGAHEEARADCLDALRSISLLDSAEVERLRARPAGELSLAELELVLDAARQGELLDAHLVSLGDLGRKDIRHEPGDAGTTKSFVDAKAFLEGFAPLPLHIITGNRARRTRLRARAPAMRGCDARRTPRPRGLRARRPARSERRDQLSRAASASPRLRPADDLEGLDEFDTDAANLQAWLDTFGLDAPYWSAQVARRTLVVGLSTVRFRDSPFSSHEVHVDPDQLAWFEHTLETHPAADGWRVLVFSHAPPMGSGLRVLQSVHIRNGCAWLNHCGAPDESRAFLRLVRQHPQIKLWCSGHFHLSHDFEDSISFKDGCAFVQVGVIGPASSRDGRRQTRLVQGDADGLRVYTVNHHDRDPASNAAKVRLDAELDYASGEIAFAHGSEAYDDEDWFSAYVPQEADGCYLESPNGQVACTQSAPRSVCWWHMADGKTLGVHDQQIVEYDAETLSPLGIVVSRDQLAGRQVVVVNEGEALVLMGEGDGPGGKTVEVVHPNEDGSYWRRLQRNKRVRQEEQAREALARQWLEVEQSS